MSVNMFVQIRECPPDRTHRPDRWSHVPEWSFGWNKALDDPKIRRHQVDTPKQPDSFEVHLRWGLQNLESHGDVASVVV